MSGELTFIWRYIRRTLSLARVGESLESAVFDALVEARYNFANVGLDFLMPAIIASFTSFDWIMPMLYAAT
jgi:hypothetical protein